MSIKIGSMNMCNFNLSSNGNSKKNFIRIAEMFVSERFDVVALQEVLSEQSLMILNQALGKHWEYAWVKPHKSSTNASKGFAYVWNSKRIGLVKTKNEYGEHTFEPRLVNQYRLDREIGQYELARNPYYARFTTSGLGGGSYYEIRLINIHIMFNKSVDVSSELSNARMRKNEFDVLMRAIYPQIADRCYKSNSPAYTIILGDYNMNLRRQWTSGSGRSSVYIDSEEIWINDGHETKCIKTVQDQLTTLKNPQNENEEISANDDNPHRGYANNYDHFSYDNVRFEKADVSYRRIDAVRDYYGDDFEKYRNEISDHIPIVIEINIKK